MQNNNNSSNIENTEPKDQNKLPNFDLLSYGTLRRYQAFFNLRDNLTKDKSDILKIVSKHFETMEIDHDKVLENFIKIEKDQQPDKNNLSRKSLRCQEKNIHKMIDYHYNNIGK